MNVAILGNGVAGISAALRLRELDPSCAITVVSGESTHHYSRPALMYLFLGHLTYRDTKPYPDDVWRDRRIDLVRDWVTAIDCDGRRLVRHRGGPIRWDRLLLATGSRPARFGWSGQDLPGVQGFYDLLDLRRLYDNTRGCRRAVLVGGGLIGIELAEMLLARGIAVTFLVRERSYWDNVLPPEESAMVSELVRAHGIDLRLATELREIHAGPDGRACAVTTGAGERIECQLVGLTTGVAPNVALAAGTPLEVGRGFLVDERLRTSVDGVFAAGDCAEIAVPDAPRNLLQQVWYTGKRQGRHVAESILGGDAPYDPGIWFNSAKFFDLEYQTYGRVEPGAPQAFWRHPRRDVSIRIAHEGGAVTGFVFLGTRYRHEVCERWIRERAPVREVAARLREAAFDPELFARHEALAAPALARTLEQELAR